MPPSKIDHPVQLPRFPAIDRSGALPMRGIGGDVGPRQARAHGHPTLILPFREEIDLALAEAPTPDVEMGGFEGVGPRVLPFSALAVEGPQAESLERPAVIDPLEDLERDAAVEHPGGRHRARRLVPPAVTGNATRGIPLPFQEVESTFGVVHCLTSSSRSLGSRVVLGNDHLHDLDMTT